MDNRYEHYHSDDDRESGKSGRTGLSGWKKAFATVGGAVLFGVIASAVFLTCNTIGRRLLGVNASGTASVREVTEPLDGERAYRTSSVVTSDVSGVVEQVMPSIVSIT